MFGNFSEDKIERIVSDFFRGFEFISKCGVVFVTDSANVGYGWVFERDGDSAACVEKYTGYEGALLRTPILVSPSLKCTSKVKLLW